MKNKKEENYLDKIPVKNENLKWSENDGKVTLEIENTGIMNKIAQKLFKKPKISYVYLDEMGSFIWCMTDGIKDITELGKEISEKFGEKANPLYERLIKYITILQSYNFITLK